jgi:hypothetical protein
MQLIHSREQASQPTNQHTTNNDEWSGREATGDSRDDVVVVDDNNNNNDNSSEEKIASRIIVELEAKSRRQGSDSNIEKSSKANEKEQSN